MRSTKTRLLILAVILLAVLSILVVCPERSKAQYGGDETIVKLYSGNNLVATWDNANKGRVDGNTYVFTIRPENKEVRISGTYSVEVIR